MNIDNMNKKTFASHENAQYWSKKNGDITPRDVAPYSRVKYWFDCPDCKHTFDITLSDVSSGGWCGYCKNRKRCKLSECQFCLANSFASNEKSKYWSKKNGDVNPRDVALHSNDKFWFDCPDCNHTFDVSPCNVNGGKWCGYCQNKKRCEYIDCVYCYNNSFASHEKAKFWSSKNGNVKPRDLAMNSIKKFWFECPGCNHTIEMKLNNIAQGKWCDYCYNRKRCDDIACINCHDTSFATHERAKYWSAKNGDITPRDVSRSNGAKFWFDCPDCKHTFDSVLSSVISGCWCGYCANVRRCEDPDCQFCFVNSFASHEKSKYWSVKNGDIKPRDVAKNANEKYLFDCPECNDTYESLLSNINKGQWCGCTKHKTETKLYNVLRIHYPTLEKQFTADWCKKKHKLPFDFCIPEFRILIELDGPQHFCQIRNWRSPENELINDVYKTKCANENGYSVIRVLQEDVWNDSNGWLNDIIKNIKYIIADTTVIHNIFIDNSNKYDNLMEML